MTDIEERLRDTLASHATAAPPPRQLLHLVRVESRRRRRRRRAGLVTAVAAAVAVAGLSVIRQERGGTDAADWSVELEPGPVSYVSFPFTPPSSAGRPTVMLVGGEPTLQYHGSNAMSVTMSNTAPTDPGAVVLPVRPGKSLVIRAEKPLTAADLRTYVAGFKDRPMAITPPFTFELVPAGFTVDNITRSEVTFAPPGIAPSAEFSDKVAVMLDKGSADGTQVTAEGVVILRRSLGDGRTLTVQVAASVALTGGDLARFAAGIRPTGSAQAASG